MRMSAAVAASPSSSVASLRAQSRSVAPALSTAFFEAVRDGVEGPGRSPALYQPSRHPAWRRRLTFVAKRKMKKAPGGSKNQPEVWIPAFYKAADGRKPAYELLKADSTPEAVRKELLASSGRVPQLFCELPRRCDPDVRQLGLEQVAIAGHEHVSSRRPQSRRPEAPRARRARLATLGRSGREPSLDVR